jgi:putative SOS response-associated peptidase YedK
VTGDHLLYGFLTTEPNAEVRPIHPKAMPVILRTAAEMDTWMTAPWAEAVGLQRPIRMERCGSCYGARGRPLRTF